MHIMTSSKHILARDLELNLLGSLELVESDFELQSCGWWYGVHSIKNILHSMIRKGHRQLLVSVLEKSIMLPSFPMQTLAMRQI